MARLGHLVHGSGAGPENMFRRRVRGLLPCLGAVAAEKDGMQLGNFWLSLALAARLTDRSCHPGAVC